MPLAPVTLQATLIPTLVAAGQLGIAVPKLALGVGIGMTTFAKASTVLSLDQGTAGPGVTLMPFVVPQPLLLAAFLGYLPANGIAGVMYPLLAVGLSVGMSLGFAQGLVTMVHTVGVGTGVAKVIPSGAVPAFVSGFAQAGLTGKSAVQLATAIGQALTTVFTPFVFPVPIAGPPSIVPLVGVPSIIGIIV